MFKQFVLPSSSSNPDLVIDSTGRKFMKVGSTKPYIEKKIGVLGPNPDLEFKIVNGQICIDRERIVKIGSTYVVDHELIPVSSSKPRCLKGKTCCNADLDHIKSFDHDDDLNHHDTWIRKINCRGKCSGNITTHKYLNGSWECYSCNSGFNLFSSI